MIADNYGDDEADDDLGIGTKRKRLVRSKIAGKSLLIKFHFADDEADDDLGIGTKRKRLVRSKIAGKSLLIKFHFADTKYDMYCNYLKVHRLAVAAKSMRHYEFTISQDVAVSS